MPGAEAIEVSRVISSIILIVNGTKQVYDAATNVESLPEAFRAVAGRLPIVRNILDSAKQHINKGDIDEDSCKGVKHVIEACEKKAKELDALFQKAIPKDGARGFERYCIAVKQLGKENEVENLMTGMLEDVQLLACERGIKTANKAQQDQIVEAVTELSAVLPSVPEHIFQETGFTNANHGSGAQYNAQGEYVAQGNARQYNVLSGTINIGSMENEAETCLSALCLTDPRDDREQLIQAKGSRVVGTCEWIKSNKLYDYWLHSHSRSQLLWLSGGPGKGKTMLSIFLAEELERTAKHSQDMLFLQYFCDNKDENRKTAVTIIRGLIFQLLQSRQELFDYILPSFKILKESLFADSSFATLWRIFEMMVRDPILGTTYCVLDGLDECDEASLEVLLTKFAALFSAKINDSSVCHLNLIVVSRDFPDFIPELLSRFPRIRLDPDADTEVNNDIYQFIEVKVNELSELRQYPESLRVHVKKVFQTRAQGTFLWVGIVAKALKKYEATAVKTALDLFPPGLDELYARMLLQIDIGQREIAAKILRWVIIAVRPLTLSELSIALDISRSPSVAFGREEIMRDQVSYCRHILTTKQDKVGLIHQSAKDYLLRKARDPNPELEVFRVNEAAVNLEIARKCLDYLQNGALAAGEVNLRIDNLHLEAFPLLSYAALHWPEHAKSLACSEDIFDLSLSFYHKKSRIRESWLKSYWALIENSHPPNAFTLLHLASYFGILPLAENLMKRKHALNKKDDSGKTALMWAARGGHEPVVRLLLEKGADLEVRDSNGDTALILAAQRGHEVMVRLLLEKGPVNSDDTVPSSKTSFIDTDETNPESSMTHEMTSLSSQRENIIDDKIPRVHGLDNDILSVVSDEEDIQSQRSSRRLPQEVWGEDSLVIMLAENVELAPLHVDAISKIGADRYIRNLRKLLKRYYLRLSQDAGSNLEWVTVSLLRSRWSRVRVAQKIVDIKRPKSEDARAQIERDAEEIQGKRPFVEDWISRNAGFASSWTQIQENTVMNTNEAAESDISSEEESSMVPSSMVPPNVSDVESFMTEGSAFHNLVTNIRVFLLPPALHPLARTIMSVPSDRLYFSAKDDNSVFNKFKIWIESITEDNWDWWPFRAKMRVLQKGETRLHWHCHCNVHLWVELSELNAERLQWVLERRSVVRNNSHLCGFRRQKQSWRNICHEITCAAGGAFQQSSSSGSSGKALTNPSQNASMGTSGNKAQASKPQMTPQKTATTGQQVTQNNINMPQIQQLLILFGVKGTRRTLELAQIDVENCEDRLLFSKMKDEYRKLRGHLRYLFSFWRLSHCDFVKFEKIRANRVIFRSKEIPTDIIYEYTPRHPHAENPPISPHEFKLAFASCSDRCLFSPFHDCVERSTGKSAIERIPKRKTPLELNKDGVEHAWGLQAQHVISFVHMLFYHFMMLAGSFGFSAWWMGKHPDDLQGAAALPTIFLALLSLFWSSAGVLKLLRDPV